MRLFPLVIATAAALPIAPASAAGTAPVTGYGTFSPGLAPIPTVQRMQFTVDGTVVGTTPGPVSCSFIIDENPSSIGSGVGSGIGRCSGAVNVSGACTSQRAGMWPTITCGSFGGTFHFAILTFPPIHDYDVTGQLTFA